MTTTRRKSYIDLAAVKRSRKSYVGGVTRAKETLQTMSDLDPSELNHRKIEGALASITRAETGFYSNLDEAQAFIAEDVAQEKRQAEEDEATEIFESSVQEARELGEALLLLTNLRRNLDDFKIDLSALQNIVQDHPEQPHHTAVEKLEAMHLLIRQDWKKTDLDQEHTLKEEIDTSKKLLTKLASEVAAHRETRDSASSTGSSASSSSHHSSHPYIELPKIKVPTFNGDLMGWSTFWATFKSTVDDRPELSSTQKLNYLRQAIKDPSLQLLLSSPLETTDTYDDVVQELKDRFQKTREIHRTIIKTLTSLSCPKHTRADLRLLYDVVKTSITNLKSTKQYDIESFLSSLIYAILPAKIQLLWDQATKKDKGVPPITQLLSFVKDHAETLPAAASTPTDKTPDPASKKSFFKKKDSPPAKGRNNVHVAAPAPAPYKWDCLLCAPEKHPLYVCPKWATYTITQRVAHINANHLCSNCLAGGHTTANCKSTYRCKECRQNHHTSIHQQQSTTPVNHSTATSHQVPDALMTTAQLLLIGPHGEELEARALIDSGAGISLVTQRVTQLLNLPLEPARLRLSVAQGETTKPLKHLTSLHLSPLHDRSIKMPCHPAVASAVTSNLPSLPVPPVTDLPHLMGLQLADPTYNVPGRIDILLGADMASTIITPDLPRQGKTSEPMAQSTKFGWTISGPVPGISHDKPTVSAYHQLPLIQTEPTTTSEPKLDTLLQAILQEQEGPEDKTAASTDTHQQVEDHYVSHTIYSSTEQRYEVTLPKKPCIQDLGESRKQAVSRFINNEKSILRKRIHPQFQEVIETYLELGHAEEVPPEDQPPTASFYLPMHAVFKESSSSTKLRVVFDGSAATITGLSLNQSLLVGVGTRPHLMSRMSQGCCKDRQEVTKTRNMNRRTGRAIAGRARTDITLYGQCVDQIISSNRIEFCVMVMGPGSQYLSWSLAWLKLVTSCLRYSELH